MGGGDGEGGVGGGLGDGGGDGDGEGGLVGERGGGKGRLTTLTTTVGSETVRTVLVRPALFSAVSSVSVLMGVVGFAHVWTAASASATVGIRTLAVTTILPDNIVSSTSSEDTRQLHS